MSDPAPPPADMRAALAARLATLRDEFARGQERLGQLTQEEDKLRATMLRISGAIQVLSEELGETNPDDAA